MRNSIGWKALLAGTSVLAGAWAPTAMAQTSSAQVEEVVVTANRREERLQTVPVAVAAITASAAEARGVTDTTSLSAAVPGLDFSRQNNSATPFLRGIGSPSAAVGQEASVATYIDGVYLSAPMGVLFAFNNIERLEVLKGPQGTLFGRNATGGVVQIITRDPKFAPEGKASIGYGNYDTWDASFYATGPITDTVAADLAVIATDQSKGWGKDLSTGDDVFTNKVFSARTKWLFDVSADTSARFAVDYSRVRDQSGLNGGFFPGAVGLDGVTTYSGKFNTRNLPEDTNDVRQGGAILRIDHDFGGVQVANISGYRVTKAHFTYDQDRTSTRVVGVTYDTSIETFSNELQFLSPADSKVQWIVGGYFLYDNSAYNPQNIAGAAVAPLPSVNLISRQITKSLAVFGQATTEIMADTNLTIGLRYTRDDRSMRATRLGTGVGPIGSFSGEAVFKKPGWRLALDHKFTPDVFGYLSYNRAFKSGLFNLASPADPPVKPEILDAYEAGLKTAWLDRRLQINGSAYYYNYKNIQVNQSFTGGQRLVNAARSEIYGLDLDLTAALSNELSLTFSGAYMHGRFKSFPGAPFFTPRPTGGNISSFGEAGGNHTLHTPEFTGALTLDYVRTTTAGDFGANIALSYNDGFFWDPQNRLKEPSRTLVNGAVSWRSADDRWGLRLWGKNLTNEYYFAWVATNTTGDGGSPSPPRTYGVTLTRNW